MIKEKLKEQVLNLMYLNGHLSKSIMSKSCCIPQSNFAAFKVVMDEKGTRDVFVNFQL